MDGRLARIYANRTREMQSLGLSENGPGRLKVRDAVKLLRKHGWFLVRQRGSHKQYKHSSRPGTVTIAGKPSDTLAPGTANSIRKQSGLNK